MNAVDLDALVAARRHALELRGLVAECACCGATYTLPVWLQLRFVGIQDVGDGEPLELRDCGGVCCRTTLAIPVALCGAWVDELRAINAVKAEAAERLLRREERQPVDRARELFEYCRGYRDGAGALGAPRQRIAELEHLTRITNALLNRAITDRAVERQRARITPAGVAALERTKDSDPAGRSIGHIDAGSSQTPAEPVSPQEGAARRLETGTGDSRERPAFITAR